MLFFKFFEAYQNQRHQRRRPQLHFRTHYLLMAHIGHLFFAKIGKIKKGRLKKRPFRISN